MRVFPIHQNPANFPDPDLFKPERFLGSKATEMTKDAFRPFEKINISALFTTISLTFLIVFKGLPRAGDQAYNVMFSSAGPAGGMSMRVSNMA